MNEPYVPRSPDLSALQPASTHPPPRALQHPHYSSHLTPSHSAQSYNGGPSPPSLYTQNSDASAFDLPQAAHASYAADWSKPPQYSQQYPPDPRFTPYAMPRGRKGPAQSDPDWLPQQQSYGFSSSNYNGAPPQTMQTTSSPEPPPKAPPGTEEGIIVKTKFPVARIKRIVQADEDVGKVAQSTPVAVSKALELFMISLALGSAQCAREKNSKKVTGQHLKAAVARDEQFDFLNEIVSKIGDTSGKEGGKERKGRETSTSEERGDDSEDEDYGKSRKKRPAAPTAKRRKKEEDD